MSTEQMRSLLVNIRDGLRRLDPVWCSLNNRDQISDEELDDLIGEVEEVVAEIETQ
jgi:hypothetical protein